MFRLARGLSLSPFRREWLVKDVVAGIVLTTLLVPQGMAYAELAGLPPITGLYTSILCLLGYAAFGPSRILVLGPDSSLGPMIAATILPLVAANGDPERAIALASMLAIMVAAIMILAAVAKLGFIADLISKPTMIGYMNGLARISLVFAELKDPVRGKIERYGLTRTIDPDHFFPTVEAAVTAFRAGTGADWTAAVQPEAGLDHGRPDRADLTMTAPASAIRASAASRCVGFCLVSWT